MRPNRKEIESRLRKLVGDKQVDSLLSFAFEYACQEADFYCLGIKCSNLNEYTTAVGLMARIRQTEYLQTVYEIVQEMMDKGTNPRQLKLSLVRPDRIPAIIHEKYDAYLKMHNQK
jgi:hypothetical protein